MIFANHLSYFREEIQFIIAPSSSIVAFEEVAFLLIMHEESSAHELQSVTENYFHIDHTYNDEGRGALRLCGNFPFFALDLLQHLYVPK